MFTNQIKTIKHPPFLAAVINHLHRLNGVGEPLVIFPNQLSIDYFQPLCDNKKWQARCLTLHQLMLAHSQITCLPTLALLGKLHGVAERILNRKESFEEFYSWGCALLEDFNRIDSYLVNGAELFSCLMQHKQLTSTMSVDQGRLDALKRASALPGLQQKEVLFFWKQLPLLYQSFRAKLLEEGSGYEGLCYRMAEPSPELMGQVLLFVGFNLLTPAEEQFITQCKAVASTTFFWDVDGHYFDHSINIAGHYLRQHRKKQWFQENFTPATYLSDPHKKVLLIESSNRVAQVQAVIAALQEQTNDGQPRFLPHQTAIVVSGSELLIPLLDQLAKLSIPLHGRLEYPFSATVIYTLVERLVQLWESAVAASGQEEMAGHMVDIVALWYPFAEGAVQSERTAMRQLLAKDAGHAALSAWGSFDLWWNKDHKALLPYLQECLTYIDSHFAATDSLFLALHKTALAYLLTYIEGLLGEMATCSVAFFLNGLKQSKLLFHRSNPLTGLYIIEVADSYNLDFEHLFFIGMNEGHFPRIPYNDSFLPYDLCHIFGLPFVDKVAEAKTAYGFYRLLQRSENIYCYCTQKSHLDASGEMSRLLIQLTFDSQLKVIPSYHSMQLLEKPILPISIQKDDAVMQLLDRFLEKERVAASSLTPSACLSYLSCPLQFYFKYLLQLKQTAWPKDATEALQLGTLFHDVMARLYKPFVGMQMDQSSSIAVKLKINLQIKEAIATARIPVGSPILLHALLEKLVVRMVALDGADAPFTLLGVEVAMKQSMVLDGARRVCLSGVIDRIDIQNHFIRIIDYKTGLANCKTSSIVDLFDPGKVKKNKAIFQLFFYAWLFQSLHGADYPQSIMPYLIPIRELFGEDYMPGIVIQQVDGANGKKYHRIENMMPYAAPFEAGLKELLLEIFNPAIPFVQTEDLEICGHCPYVRICQRD
ncbi:PD-(D/E)XK nuclease family protein [Cardinium endosymbiont of Nabis limbatus]|uniref:PD-(D/E)XK nuclease family protein n=1 Tax=Cardinium endosymbiont of Nabis limbatus TaxID=3066217 RepID=UPI003AF3B7F7